MAFPRAAGILLHPTSLPGGHLTGDLGEPAYAFVDFLHRAGVGLWQMLPLGPANNTGSPYQALSSFAGNPLLVSLDLLVEDGLLTKADLPARPADERTADFDQASALKETVLKKAHAAFLTHKPSEPVRERYATFCREEAAWLDDFALFMAVKKHENGKAWFQWNDKELARRVPAALTAWREKLAGTVAFESFCQFLFFSQWTELKRYANEHGVKLVGDIPIYTAHDSADVWAAPQFFDIDKDGNAGGMAGCPPDYFSPDGQLWGNPLYRWDKLRETDYAWWVARVQASLRLVDIVRIDHFRGFEAYWAIPAGDKTARNGVWVKGPGEHFFDRLRAQLGELPIIAEDLGVITPEVDALRLRNGFPGMKILQFAFGPGAQAYLPHMYEKNCVVYSGTHDNDTSRSWYDAAGQDYAHMDKGSLAAERDKFRRYAGRDGSDAAWDLIRLALGSAADTAIVPMQDVLNLGNDCRMNRPGTGENQWRWRMTAQELLEAPCQRLREFVELYDRLPQA